MKLVENAILLINKRVKYLIRLGIVKISFSRLQYIFP